jgi:hypothetical protein
MGKKQLLTREEIKSFVSWMFVEDKKEHVPKEAWDSYNELIEASGCHTALDYFNKCIDRLK